jgi:hypothetical protein
MILPDKSSEFHKQLHAKNTQAIEPKLALEPSQGISHERW